MAATAGLTPPRGCTSVPGFQNLADRTQQSVGRERPSKSPYVGEPLHDSKRIGRAVRPAACYGDHFRLGTSMAELPDELDSVHVRECEVHHNDIHGRVTAKSQTSMALVCLDHFVAGPRYDPSQASAHCFLPIHHQNARRAGVLASLTEPASET